MHAPPPHFSSSVHSTRSVASSALHSTYTDTRSLEGLGDDDSAAAGGAAFVIERRRQADAVRNRLAAAALSILESYAETAGQRLADVLQVCLAGEGGVLRKMHAFCRFTTVDLACLPTKAMLGRSM